MIEVVEILYAVLAVLAFPGLAFLLSLALFVQYLVRKLSARCQSRMGPSYVGPFGALQPFYDLWKLLRLKEIMVTRFSMIRAAELSLIIGISFVISSVVFLPMSPFNIRSEFDVLIFFYMVSVIPLIAMVMASLAMPGPYTTIGVSRLLSLATLSEPTFFASVIIPVYLASRHEACYHGAFMSIGTAYECVINLWSGPRTAVLMLLCFVAFVVSVQAKALYQPFNIPEAEQEIIAGFETEMSGPLLALARLLHDAELAVSILLGVYTLLGGPSPFKHFSVMGVLSLSVKYVALTLLIVIIKNIMGRYRIEQALTQLFKYGLIPIVAASILTMAA